MENIYNLKEKTILITGATGYLGRELSLGLAKLGATLYINSRYKSKCIELVKEIKNLGLKAIAAPFDVTSENSIKKYIDNIDILDVLINNAYAGHGGNILNSKTQNYIDSYEVTVVASANLIRLLEPNFLSAVSRNGYASIINIASMYGMVSPDQRIYDSIHNTNPPFYGSAKAALIQLTKYAACELAQKNIRVNSISPGPFPSVKTQTKFPNMIKKIKSKVPMGRLGKPIELVGPTAFLASEASNYITGINIPVDGGWTAW